MTRLARRVRAIRLLILAPVVALAACRSAPVEAKGVFRAHAARHTISIFEVYAARGHESVGQDVGRTLAGQLDRLRRELRYPYQHPVVVEIYGDQAEYDAHLMNRSVTGSPACSGRRTIQMVSPKSPIRVPGLQYEARLSMAVHELAHLFLDEIGGEVPMWLEEGTASYEGDAEGYRRLCRLPSVERFLATPASLAEIESSYGRLTGADVLSFTLVDFIVSTRGFDALNDLIRHPGDLERVLGSRAAVELEWHAFVQQTLAVPPLR